MKNEPRDNREDKGHRTVILSWLFALAYNWSWRHAVEVPLELDCSDGGSTERRHSQVITSILSLVISEPP